MQTSNFQIMISITMGCIVSILSWFMIQTLYAQILVDFVIDSFGNNAYFNILTIFLGGEFIAFLLGIIISFLVVQKIKKTTIIKACVLGFVSNLLLWFVISFIGIFLLYPGVFENLIGYEILIVSPIIVMYFGIYVLNDITRIWLYTQITYFVFFGLYLILYRNQKKKIKIVQYEPYELI